MGQEGGGNRELLISMYKTIVMQSFASTVFAGDGGGSGELQGEARVFRTMSATTIVCCCLLSSLEADLLRFRVWISRTQRHRIRTTETAFEMLSNYLERCILKITRFFENRKICVSVLCLWFTHFEESQFTYSELSFLSYKIMCLH